MKTDNENEKKGIVYGVVVLSIRSLPPQHVFLYLAGSFYGVFLECAVSFHSRRHGGVDSFERFILKV